MADVKPLPSEPCQFDVAWQGKCGKPSDNGWCTEHESLKCCVCNKKAVRSCDHTSALVCGASLCKDCQHSFQDDGHVTKEVFDQQSAARRKEEVERKSSRTNSERLLNGEGHPANLFELLKGDWKAEGYVLEKCYFLYLHHSLMAFFPAIVSVDKRMVVTTDPALLIDLWQLLPRRRARFESVTAYVHKEKGLSYQDCESQLEQERAKPNELLERPEFDLLVADAAKKDKPPFRWAPGLIGGQDYNPEEFLRTLESVAKQFCVQVPTLDVL